MGVGRVARLAAKLGHNTIFLLHKVHHKPNMGVMEGLFLIVLIVLVFVLWFWKAPMPGD